MCDVDIAILSVRLSVCLSVTFGSPIILVLSASNTAPAPEHWNNGGHGQFSGGTWRARGARAYTGNGCLKAEPPAGSRGRAPDQEVRGAKPT